MMLPVIWTNGARADLFSIVRFIGERNPFAAARIESLIRESTYPLTEHPYMFKRSERMPECREIVVHPNYIVIYRVADDCIKVLRVLHARQNYPG